MSNPEMRPALVINRKHARVQELLGHVLHTISPYLVDGSYRDCVRELEDLFYAAGVDIITESMRAEAGLPMRDHHGLTLQELKLIEAKLMVARMSTPMAIADESMLGEIEFMRAGEVRFKSALSAAKCPWCGFLGEPASKP